MKKEKSHITRSDLTAIILAGGRSSRMGTDKGMFLYNGLPFISHILKAVEPLAKETLIVSDHSHYDQFNVRRIQDEFKEHGPLAGLCSGLKTSATEWNLVLSCDVPMVSAELLNLLLDRTYDGFDIIQLHALGRDMPLIARYNRNCIAGCEKLIQNGEKRLMALQDFHSNISVQVPPELEDQAANINRISDLIIAQDED